MPTDLQVLLIAAIAVSFLHTLTGPDHYLPFIALAKSRKWSLSHTLFWTSVCGSGHVLSSVVLGLGGAAIGWSVAKVKWLEGVRGTVAGWLLLGLGIVYGVWGLVQAGKNKKHKHFDFYDDGSVYVYEHKHGTAVASKNRYAVTPWVLFIIFVLGPCKPMIPLLYFPAAQHSVWGMLLLIIVYSVCTLLAMVLMVFAGYHRIKIIKTEKLERYMHALGGFTIFTCGLGMVFLNW